MVNDIKIGVLVSNISTLFPFIKHLNLQVGMKAWKIWESKIENIYRNDILIHDDEPINEAGLSIINNFFSRGGIIIQLFSLSDETDFEYIMKDGKIVDDKFSPVVENVDLDAIAGGRDGLDIKMVLDEGIFVSFSRNIVSERFISDHSQVDASSIDDESDDRVREEDQGDVLSRGSGSNVEGDPSQNLRLLYNLIRFLKSMGDERETQATVENVIPKSKTAIFIHGRSLWLDNSSMNMNSLLKKVFHHLGISDLLGELEKQPEMRRIDPDKAEVFPDIYYYHQSFSDDEDHVEVVNATKYLEQAKKVHAVIRAERSWDLDVTPLFFQDIAAEAGTDTPRHEKVYIYPPALIASKSRKMNHALLQKCILEVLARKGTTFYRLDGVSGQVKLYSFNRSLEKVNEWFPNEDRAVVLVHGPEFSREFKDMSFDDFKLGLSHLFSDEGINPDASLKILVQVVVDVPDLQKRIKQHSFQLKKVEDRVKARIKNTVSRLQAKLHAHMYISRLRKSFEDYGFKMIEIKDDRRVEQDVKLFFIDQLLPYVNSKAPARVYYLLPESLESYLKGLLVPVYKSLILVSLKGKF
ncbi:MAG: hypothetical protein ACTSVI_13385 [Promethearchaeota archaeon]